MDEGRGDRWRKKLYPEAEVPSELREYYDVSVWIPSLRGTLVSPPGVEKTEDGFPTGAVFICHACYGNMSVDNGKPPKFSIANGFDIGTLPESVQDATGIERRLTSMTCLAVPITVLRGGKHTFIKGHVTVVTMDPVPIAVRLPQILSKEAEKFLVVIAGKLTPAQDVSAMKRHACRVEVVRRLLEFYAEHNKLYQEAGVIIDQTSMELLGQGENEAVSVQRVDEAVLGSNEDDADQNCYRDAESARNGVASSDCEEKGAKMERTSQETELTYKEIGTIMVNTSPQTTVEALKTAQDTVLVRNHGRYVSDYDGNLLGLAFPDLFPYGRGHPGTKRRVPVSFEECCRHYLRLSPRQFAQHSIFGMVAFDLCGKRRVAISTTVRAKYRSDEFEAFGRVTREELGDALQRQKEKRENAFAGRAPVRDEDKDVGSCRNANGMLKNVRISQARMWGSGEERLMYRRQAFAMDTFMKSGAFFVTITPSDIGTMMISILAGVVCPEDVLKMDVRSVHNRSQRIRVAGLDP